MKNLLRKDLIILITMLVLIFYNYPLQAEIYPTQVKFIIRSQAEIVGQDDFFEILELDEYILIPIVSLSRWLDIDLNYDRNNKLLTVYYEEKDINIIVDLKYNIYYDFPDWSKDPPKIVEGDFYLAVALVEHLTGAKVIWEPRKQELILDYDASVKEDDKEIAELRIKKRPEEISIVPEVTGPDFNIASIQYKFGFDYEFSDDENDDFLEFNKILYIYGRAGDWAISTGHRLEYDLDSEEYEFENKLLRARNIENDRIIIIGDNKYRFPNTIGRTDIRGFYLQYPIQQISDRRAYTAISGEAEEGSTITLYVNDRKIDSKYLYQGEEKYYFENVPITEERTNIIRVLIQDIEGKEREIVKKVAGSLNVFPKGTNEGIYTFGSNNRRSDSESLLELGGMQIKYAPSAGSSLFWELGVERNYNNSDSDEYNLGSLLRVAVSPEDLPLVFLADWLAGRDVDLVEHGVRASTLYTKEDGYIRASLAYVPPIVEKRTNAEAGQQALINLEKELNENWNLDLGLENKRSILDMENFEQTSINLTFDYSDRARNSLVIAAELGSREEEIFWRNLDLRENNRDWFDISLTGRTFRGPARLGSEIIYVISDINFQDDLESGEIAKREDFVSAKLNLSSSLTDNLVLSGGLKSSFTWLEGERLESDADLDLRVRLRTGDFTSITAGISTEVDYRKNKYGIESTNEVQEVELFLRHDVPRNITLITGVKKTFLEDESYLRSNAGLDYENPDNDWGLRLDYEYIAPYANRENSQKKFGIAYKRHLVSGLEALFNFERTYATSRSEEPVYEASIYLSQALGFTPSRVIGQKYPRIQRETYNSFIAGLVYLDLNGSGKRDPGDPLLEGISISNDGRRTNTDQDGIFIFENLRSGLYKVGFNLRELPEEYKVLTEAKVIQIRENENIFLEFALTQLGELKGNINLEQKAFADIDREEIALNLIKLEIKELNRIIFSRSDGSFNVKNIPLGEYKLRVIEESLPAGTKLKEQGIYEFNITPDKLINQEIKINLISNE